MQSGDPVLQTARMLVMAITRLQSVACKALGPGFVLAGMTLVGGVTVSSVWYDPVVPQTEPKWKQWLWYGFGLWLVFNIYFNWFFCAMTDPGSPPAGVYGEVDTVVVGASPEGNLIMNRRIVPPANRAAADGVEFRACRKCDTPKPPRAHHCSVCDKCILMMDHHCPWMNNCIGYRNYRYFVTCLIYLWTGCFYLVLLLTRYYDVAVEFGMEKWFSSEGITKSPKEQRSSRMHQTHLFSFLLCFSVGCAISILLGFHIFLISSAQTSIEFYTNRSKSRRFRHEGKLFVNDYDLGTSRNWQQVYGKSTPFIWLLPSTRPPPGDGVHWPTCKSIVLKSAAQMV